MAMTMAGSEASGRPFEPVSAAQIGGEARVGDRRGLHPDDLDALARWRGRRPRRASRAGGRRGRAACRRAGRRCRARRSRPPSPRGRRRARASPSTTVAIRSDSLTRSSAAPSTTVSPSAKQPSSATSGSSSIASGTSSAVTRVPRSGPCATSSSRERLGVGRRASRASRARRAASRPCARGCGRSRSGSSCAAIPSIRSARAGHERGRGGVEGGRRRVAGDVERVEAQLVRLRDRDPVALAAHAGAGGREQPLGVVAAGLGLDDRRLALGEQPREQHARLDLRARRPAARTRSRAAAAR